MYICIYYKPRKENKFMEHSTSEICQLPLTLLSYLLKYQIEF